MKKISNIWLALIFFGAVIISALSLRLINFSSEKTTLIKIGGINYAFQVVDTERARFRGLSGRDSMGGYAGMYFIFDRPGIYGIVMREMRFPLDVVWLNGEKIVDLGEGIPPEPGVSEAELTVYSNEFLANGILELPAGFIAEHDVKVGDRVIITR